MHKGYAQLQKELDEAKQFVEIGALYWHYKNPEQLYEVTELAVLEATDEICVLYCSRNDTPVSFVRPLAGWLDKVEFDGMLQNRFNLKAQ